MTHDPIPFNKPLISSSELDYVTQSLISGKLSGDQFFTKQCQSLIVERYSAQKVLLTTSCTAALEMAALLCDIRPGDEVIMPSFTFVSTANAFLLRGADIRFVDIRPDTLNLDETLLVQAITGKTKAIVPVHYAGIVCEMDVINRIAEQEGLYVIEDAAQAVDSQYKGQYAGTVGDAGAFSFHETKNFVAGEGGALVLNRPEWIERAEIIREKGTNRSQFIRGQVDKYSWVDIGSSYVLSDLLAAVLLGQLESIDQITLARQRVVHQYREQLQPLADKNIIRLPKVPTECISNEHMFYLICKSPQLRDELLERLNEARIQATFHYVPLHNSPMAVKMGFHRGPLPVTETVAATLIRLPLYGELTTPQISRICAVIHQTCMKYL